MRTTPLVASVLAAALVLGCQTAPKTAGDKAILNQQCREAVALFKQTDPTMTANFFGKAYGYAVFPRVSKGGALVGGAHGQGQVYEGGLMVGFTSLSQGSVGAQIGGQVYSEIIFFEHEQAMKEFKSGEFALAAQVSAIAADAGASAAADYSKGVAVFTVGLSGLMVEASVGGQQFDYKPK